MLKIIISLFVGILVSGSEISQSLVKKQLSESFITRYEYGKMLYNNPRGISCAKCHGDNAKGTIISKFKHVVKEKSYNCQIRTKDMTTISLEKFILILNPDNLIEKPVFDTTDLCSKMIYGNTMPKYFLTQDELESIHYYITHINQR